MSLAMNEVTRILERAQQGDPKAANELLPLVYDELRKLAAARMAREAPGHTLQPTALVHDAWRRLVGDANPRFDGRAHFFAAAAEAMRRILVERARRRLRLRHGGGQERVDLDVVEIPALIDDQKVVQVSEALAGLEAVDPLEAQIVKLKFFMGMKVAEIATALSLSEKTVQRHWSHAKAWLFARIQSGT